MSFRSFSRIRVLAMSLAAVTATSTVVAIAGAAGPAAAATSNGCPASKTVGSLATASNVAAKFTNNGDTTSYTFLSLTNENPVSGVPGLIKYCVYPNPTALPSNHTVAAVGANDATWVYGTGSNNFAFVRPGGDKSDIPLDGTTTTMGTATWNTVPTGQIIILHINDPTVCASLYGSGTSATCFVKPSTGPICAAGETTVAYNAMPFDVVDCLNPAIGFEATSTSEFGNKVNLAGTGNISQLNVDFQSYACENGHWFDGTCSSTSGDTFTWPVTANIYDPNGPGGLTTPIATDTENQVIPYRPSANSTCPANSGPAVAGAAWFNPAAVGGGACQNSIGIVLHFSHFVAPGGGTPVALPGTVVWTVAFNTSDFGVTPQRPSFGSCPQGDPRFPTLGDGGCPYDSLNVGDNGNTGGVDNPGSHISGAPYAGTDFTTGVAYLNQGSGLQSQTGWDGFRPLGEIITTP